MRLVSYRKGGAFRAGIEQDNQVYDLFAAMKRAKVGEPVDNLRDLLSQSGWRQKLKKLKLDAKATSSPLSRLKLGPPIAEPRKLIISGLNSYSHLKELEGLTGKVEPPKYPMVIGKAASTISGPNDDIILPPETKKLDYECELAVVIGRKCRRVSTDKVRSYIAGYMTMDDVSARDVQMAEGQALFYRVHFPGKSFDTFCPTGPALVTIDEFPPKRVMKMRTLVNGKVRQDSDTADFIFTVEQVISHVSQIMTLMPGDIVSMGSPAGVILADANPVFLKAGDVVRCEIEGIGAVENKIKVDKVKKAAF